jgi:hypothetical protein
MYSQIFNHVWFAAITTAFLKSQQMTRSAKSRYSSMADCIERWVFSRAGFTGAFHRATGMTSQVYRC